MPRVKLFLDWDGTLTKKDTLQVLSNIGHQVNERNGRQVRPWIDIVQAYLEDLKEHTASYKLFQQDRRSIRAESEFLASLKQVEERSIGRVEKAGVFRDVNAEDLKLGAKEAVEKGVIELRPGWMSLFELGSSKKQSLELGIISVNWSRLFIQSCLLAASARQNLDPASVQNIHCSANEIYETGSLTGGEDLRSSADKATRLRVMMEPVDDEQISVYVGDSIGDFDALLVADVGVCMRDEPLGKGQKELADAYARVGVILHPLADAKLRKDGEREMVLYWVNDLSDVAKFLDEKILHSSKHINKL